MAVQKTNNFWSGITNEPRSTLPSAFWYSENLDVGVRKSVKQVVNNQAENPCSYSVDNYITRVIQIGSQIYGLGQDNNTNKDTTIWTKTNALNGAWSIPTNGTISGSTFNAGYSLFVACNGIIYFDGGNSKIARYTIATNTMDSTGINLANAKGGVVWQGDVWCWSGQDVYVINTSTGSLTQKKTISSEQTIVELVPNGNLLNIVCTSTVTMSKMYIYDGVSTTSWVDIVEIGLGTVSGAAMLEGMVVVAISTPNRRTLKLRGYNGGTFQDLFTYTGRPNRAGTYNYIMPASRLKTFSGFVYFITTGTKPDDTYAGLYQYAIARFGREDSGIPMSFSFYKTLDFTSVRGIDGALTNNDFTIIESIVGATDTTERAVLAFINSDTSKTTSFLSSSNTYTAQPGVLETCILNGGETYKDKQFVVRAEFHPLPTAGQVVCKYRKDNELTWTTIFTETTDGAIQHTSDLVDPTGLQLPTCRELSLRFELTGGAELTGWVVDWVNLDE